MLSSFTEPVHRQVCREQSFTGLSRVEGCTFMRFATESRERFVQMNGTRPPMRVHLARAKFLVSFCN